MDYKEKDPRDGLPMYCDDDDFSIMFDDDDWDDDYDDD
jgi:hypothetical protein